MSDSTIIATSSSKPTFGSQPSLSRALLGSPMSRSTSAGRTKRGSIDNVGLVRSQAGGLERDAHELAHAVRSSGRDDVVVGLRLLQHQPHRAHVVAREAPVAMRVEVSEPQLFSEAELDARNAVGDLARHELLPSTGRLVVEPDSAARVQSVRLAIVHGDPMAVDLRDAVGAARIERRLFGLRRLDGVAEHLRTRRLIEANRGIDLADRFEHARHAQRGELAGEHRLPPRRRNERLRGEIVDLVGRNVGHDRGNRTLIEQVARDEFRRRRRCARCARAPRCSCAASCRRRDSPPPTRARRDTSRLDP